MDPSLAVAAPLVTFPTHRPAVQAALAFAGAERPAEPEAPAQDPAPSSESADPPDTLRPEALHPGLWFGHQLARQVDAAVPTGFPELDAHLPGGGWPRRALTELLLPRPGIGEIRLVAHGLVETQRLGRPVMLFDPPARLSAPALAQLGFQVSELLVIQSRERVVPTTDSLWALEQALKSGHVGAVLAWLPPRLRAERLRRLQLAAHAHDGPAFVFCEAEAAPRPTAAPLRLALKPVVADRLSVRILKRRGPVLERPLLLALPPVLSTAARRRVVELDEFGQPLPEAVAGSGGAGRRGGVRDAPVMARDDSRLDRAVFVELSAEPAGAGGEEVPSIGSSPRVGDPARAVARPQVASAPWPFRGAAR